MGHRKVRQRGPSEDCDRIVVAVGQCAVVPGDLEDNLAIIRRTAREAADVGADLLVLLEMVLTRYASVPSGWPSRSNRWRPQHGACGGDLKRARPGDLLRLS